MRKNDEQKVNKLKKEKVKKEKTKKSFSNKYLLIILDNMLLTILRMKPQKQFPKEHIVTILAL